MKSSVKSSLDYWRNYRQINFYENLFQAFGRIIYIGMWTRIFHHGWCRVSVFFVDSKINHKYAMNFTINTILFLIFIYKIECGVAFLYYIVQEYVSYFDAKYISGPFMYAYYEWASNMIIRAISAYFSGYIYTHFYAGKDYKLGFYKWSSAFMMWPAGHISNIKQGTVWAIHISVDIISLIFYKFDTKLHYMILIRIFQDRQIYQAVIW